MMAGSPPPVPYVGLMNANVDLPAAVPSGAIRESIVTLEHAETSVAAARTAARLEYFMAGA